MAARTAEGEIQSQAGCHSMGPLIVAQRVTALDGDSNAVVSLVVQLPIDVGDLISWPVDGAGA